MIKMLPGNKKKFSQIWAVGSAMLLCSLFPKVLREMYWWKCALAFPRNSGPQSYNTLTSLLAQVAVCQTAIYQDFCWSLKVINLYLFVTLLLQSFKCTIYICQCIGQYMFLIWNKLLSNTKRHAEWAISDNFGCTLISNIRCLLIHSLYPHYMRCVGRLHRRLLNTGCFKSLFRFFGGFYFRNYWRCLLEN